ncbi:MAG: hypothetical protein R3230_00960 [Nitrosopumilaceae archaeon]|nr:hypothetical protein [Nitrosopumilaceae archaeon]
MDWNQIASLSTEDVYKFRKELFVQVFDIIYSYHRNGDDEIIVCYLLETFDLYPELKDMYISYANTQSNIKDLWSDSKMIMRFFKKLIIVYDSIIQKKEIESAK